LLFAPKLKHLLKPPKYFGSLFTGWLYNQKGTYFNVPAHMELSGLSKEALLLLISSHTD